MNNLKIFAINNDDDDDVGADIINLNAKNTTNKKYIFSDIELF